MKRSTLILLKTLVWIACLIPQARLVYGALTPDGLGADPSARIVHTTGYTALVLLAISLAITPVRRLLPRLGWLVRFRRLFGLFAFYYATIHILGYLGTYVYFDMSRLLEDLTKRRYIIAGAAAWLILLALALTSTTWAIRKMGGKRWNALHRLVYVAAACALIHFWWQVKTGVLTPLPLTIVIAVLLLARVVFAMRKSGKARAVAAD
jgi:methionine sulfoxide reductase heme-binding subunit